VNIALLRARHHGASRGEAGKERNLRSRLGTGAILDAERGQCSEPKHTLRFPTSNHMRAVDMPATPSKRKPKEDDLDLAGKAGIFVLPILVLTIVTVLAINYPMALVSISDAAQTP
jgi:hypothetical protein